MTKETTTKETTDDYAEIKDLEKRLKKLKIARQKTREAKKIQSGIAYNCTSCGAFYEPARLDSNSLARQKLCYDCDQKRRNDARVVEGMAKFEFLVGSTIKGYQLDHNYVPTVLVIQKGDKTWQIEFDSETDWDGGHEMSLSVEEVK